MRAILDAECDNLLPAVTRIWCISVLCNGVLTTYTDKESFLEASKDWTEIVGHGILSYDMWVIWRLFDAPFTVGPDSFNGKPVKFIDTLVLSRYLWPDRPWNHGLEGWGEHLGYPKGSHSDWSQLSDEMIEYNRQDVRVTEKVLDYLLKEMNE